MLLEINIDTASLVLRTMEDNVRKATGSYFTPIPLVDSVLDNALDPVIEESLKGMIPQEQEEALLNLKICDPTCGAGFFLQAAAKRLARRLVQIRTKSDDRESKSIQQAMRERDLEGVMDVGLKIKKTL